MRHLPVVNIRTVSTSLNRYMGVMKVNKRPVALQLLTYNSSSSDILLCSALHPICYRPDEYLFMRFQFRKRLPFIIKQYSSLHVISFRDHVRFVSHLSGLVIQVRALLSHLLALLFIACLRKKITYLSLVSVGKVSDFWRQRCPKNLTRSGFYLNDFFPQRSAEGLVEEILSLTKRITLL